MENGESFRAFLCPKKNLTPKQFSVGRFFSSLQTAFMKAEKWINCWLIIFLFVEWHKSELKLKQQTEKLFFSEVCEDEIDFE